MASQSERPISTKMLILLMVGMISALGGGALVMLYLGAFKDPEVYRDVPTEYRIAYLPHTGSYSNLEPLIEQVAEHLRKAEIDPVTPCALFLDNVSEVDEARRRAKVGYLVGRSDYIPGPLEELIIPSREVIVATFEGGTLLGSHKAYKAMREWSRFNGYSLSLPAFEIYHPDGKVEYQLPIHKQYKD